MSNTAQPTKSKPVPKNKLTFVFHDLFDAPISGLEYMVMADEDILDHGKTNDTGETKTISPLTGRLVGIFVKKSADEFKLITSINVPYGKNAIILRSPKMLLGFSTFLHQDTAGDYKPHGHVVKEGETIESVAHAKQTDEKELKKVNKVTHGTKVPAGKVLKVPGKKHSATSSAQESKKAEPAATPKNPSADSSASSATQASPNLEQQSQPSQDAGATTSGASQESNTSNGVPGMATIAAAASTASGGSVTAPADKSAQTSTTEGNSGSTETNSGVVNDQPSNTAAKPADTTKTSADSAETKPEQDKTIADRQQAGKQVATEITKPQEKGFDDKGKPVTTIGHLCQNQDACIKLGAPPSDVILEINIRLVGFGGALPTNEFTDLTEKCVKQFQRDYMHSPETGRVCGGTLAALDEFMKKYSLDKYFNEIKCGCATKVKGGFVGGCQGWGFKDYIIHPQTYKAKNKEGELVTKTAPPQSLTERFGIHRCVVWILRAALFYLEKDKHLGFGFAHVSSGYRCHVYVDHLKLHAYGNHIGQALDLQFNTVKTNALTREVADMNLIRKEVFVKYMNAIVEPMTGDPRPKNRIWLEPPVFRNGEAGSKSWVHVDVTDFENKYHNKSFYVQSLIEANGIPLMDMARAMYPKMVLCGGNGGVMPPQKNEIVSKRQDPSSLHMSEKAKNFVKGYEGYSEYYYDDMNGHATSGWGHLVSEKSCKALGIGLDDRVQKEQVLAWWDDDVRKVEINLQKEIKAPLYQYEFDALCCLSYNIGSIKTIAPKLHSYVNNGKYAEAAHEFLDITNKGNAQLKDRRQKENDMFLKNIYTISECRIATKEYCKKHRV